MSNIIAGCRNFKPFHFEETRCSNCGELKIYHVQTTIMKFRKTDYSLLAITYANDERGWIVCPTKHHEEMAIKTWEGKVKTILIIEGNQS